MIPRATKTVLLAMALMPSINLSVEDQATALRVAKDSIQQGLTHGSALDVITSDYSQELQQTLACFVTLHKNNQLRGCIGALEAYQPLIDDIAEHAFAAAFQDPRFPSLDQTEFEKISIEISVLSKPESMIFKSEDDLLQQVRPEIDGLILEHGFNRGTFLPSVWQQLPDKKEFLKHLKMKAGLPAQWWENDVKISRYTTFLFE